MIRSFVMRTTCLSLLALAGLNLTPSNSDAAPVLIKANPQPVNENMPGMNFQGRWRVVQQFNNGIENDRPATFMEFEGNQVYYHSRDRVGRELGTVLVFNPQGRQGEIDMVTVQTRNSVSNFTATMTPGIYRFEGNRLTICVAGMGGRPRDFTSGPNSNRILTILERVDAQ